MSLEEKLTGLRKEKGLTQLELAEAVRVSRQAVSRWEVGTAIPTTENLVALSQIYSVTVDDLLNGREELPAPRGGGKGALACRRSGRLKPGGADPGSLRRRAAPEPAGGHP